MRTPRLSSEKRGIYAFTNMHAFSWDSSLRFGMTTTKDLLPLNGTRWFRRDVIDHAVNPTNFVDDATRNGP